MTRAIIGHRGDVVAGGIGVALGQFAKQIRVAVLVPVIPIAEHERCTTDRDGAVRAASKQLPGIDDIDSAETQTFVDVDLFAQGRGRKDFDPVTPIGGGHQQVVRGHGAGVIRLA